MIKQVTLAKRLRFCTCVSLCDETDATEQIGKAGFDAGGSRHGVDVETASEGRTVHGFAIARPFPLQNP